MLHPHLNAGLKKQNYMDEPTFACAFIMTVRPICASSNFESGPHVCGKGVSATNGSMGGRPSGFTKITLISALYEFARFMAHLFREPEWILQGIGNYQE